MASWSQKALNHLNYLKGEKKSQMCMSEVADTSVRGTKRQGMLKVTCTLLNYPQHHFHATKFYVGFFSEHNDEEIRGVYST